MGRGLDQGGGRRDFPVARVGLMVGRVVADLIAVAEQASHRLLAAGDLLADLEEGRLDVLFAEDVGEGFGVCARAVVEGEGDDVAVAGPVGEEAVAAAAAADDPHRTEPEEAGARRRQARLAAPAATATVDHPPAVAVWEEAGPIGRQRDRQLLRARPADPGGDGLAADPAAAGIEEGHPDAEAGAVPAAEAELPRAGATQRAQREAEEAGRAPRRGQAVEPRQRHRARGLDREDQTPPGLRDAGFEQFRSRPGPRGRWGVGPGPPEGEAQRGAEQGRNAQDLARAAVQGAVEAEFRGTCPY